MEKMKLSTYPQAQGGRLNRKNIVVSRPENALNKGKSPNFDTAKNFAHNTSLSQKFYGEKDNLICSKNNNLSNNQKTNFSNPQNACFHNKNNLTTQNVTSNKIKFFDLEQKFQINNFINISLFSGKNNQNYNETNQNISHILDAKQDNFQTNKSRLENNHINITLFGSKCNQQTQENEDNTTKIKNKTKLLALIFSLFFVFSTILTSGVFLIVNHIKALLDATTRDNIGNILKDSNSVNYDTYQLLLTKLGSYTDSTKKTQSEINSGKPVVFQMGTVNGNLVEWQVVYQYGDIITVWMTNLYTVSVHNTTTPFVKYPNATIRTNVQNIYNAQKTSYGVIDNITVSPNDTTKMPQAYIDAQAVDGNYGHSCNKGDNTLANVSDKYWLPSNYEVFSLWGLGDDDRGYADGSGTSSNITCLDGTQGNNNIYTIGCWLRSGSSIAGDYALRVSSSGSAVVSLVHAIYGVRPACHISLSALSRYTIGNLLKDENTVSSDAYQALLSALGNDTTSIRNSASINNGNPVIFQMGEVNGNPIYWQVVYQTADYITVWMTNSYTAEYFNYSGGSIKNSTLLGYTTGPYSNTGNYSRSVIHDLTKKIYDKVSTTFPVFADVVVAPSTVATVKDWQSTQKNAYWNSTSYWSITNGLGTNTYTGGGYTNKADTNPYNWSYSSCMSDMFWIPSHYEVFNIDTASSVSDTNGYWGLSSSTYIKDNSSTALDGSDTKQYCWLRSGYSVNKNGALRVDSSGSASNYDVNRSYYGVRPAAHLSLSALLLKSSAKFKITTTVNNDTMGTTSGDGLFNKDGTESTTITATPNYGYVFEYWQEESTGNKIYSNPYTFTVTKSETYTAYFRSTSIFITTSNGGSEISSQTVDNLNTSNNYSLKFTANNYLTQIQFSGDSTPRTLKSSNGVFSDISSCTTLTYYTNTSGSELYLNILNWHGDEDLVITLYFTNTAQNYKAASGGGVETVAVQSTIGGSAELVGDDYTNLTSGDTITVVARFKLNGYQFDGWYIDGELITTDMSARLTYDDIKGKVIVAQFSKISNEIIDKINTDTETEDNGGFV